MLSKAPKTHPEISNMRHLHVVAMHLHHTSHYRDIVIVGENTEEIVVGV